MELFALSESSELGERVAAALGCALSPVEERAFEDGEHKIRPLTSVRGKTVFVLQSLHGGPLLTPNDKLVRLLFFVATLKENGASRVMVLIPYLAYARKDRQTKPRDPLCAKYVARLLEAAGTNMVVGLEVHNMVAFQNAFRCQTVHLDMRSVFADRAIAAAGDGPVVVASPDPGGVKRSQLFRERLESRLGRPVGHAFLDKRRSAGRVSGDILAGDVKGAVVLVVDDLVASGGTLARAAARCIEEGARDVLAFAAHGLFVGSAAETLESSRLTKLIVSDSVPPHRLEGADLGGKLEVVSIAPLLADAVRRLTGEGSVAELIGETD